MMRVKTKRGSILGIVFMVMLMLLVFGKVNIVKAYTPQQKRVESVNIKIQTPKTFQMASFEDDPSSPVWDYNHGCKWYVLSWEEVGGKKLQYHELFHADKQYKATIVINTNSNLQIFTDETKVQVNDSNTFAEIESGAWKSEITVTYTFPKTEKLKADYFRVDFPEGNKVAYHRGEARHPSKVRVRYYQGGNDILTLEENVHYKLSYPNEVTTPGQGKVRITGIGECTGYKDTGYIMENAPIGNVQVKLSGGSQSGQKLVCTASNIPTSCLVSDEKYTCYISEDGNNWYFEKELDSSTREYTIRQGTDGKYVKVVFSAKNHSGEVSSNIVEVNPLTITEQPKNTTAAVGTSAALRVKVTGGNAPYTYQWVAATENEVFNGDDYGDESNDPNLIFSKVEDYNAGSYWCVITDAAGKSVTSKSATLTVTGVAPFQIVTQPKSQTVETGKAAAFTVSVSGGRAPYRYSWEEELADYTFKAISTESSSLTITPTEAGKKTYRVVIQDTAVPSQTRISEPFTLTATKPAVTPTTPTTPTEPASGLKNGTTVTDKKSAATYTVSNAKNKEVQYKAPKNKKASTITIPSVIKVKGVTYKVTGIANNAFKNNAYIKVVKGGANLRVIGKNAFYGCKKLKSISLNKKVTTIEAGAFCKCTSLTKITIPASVAKIGTNAFNGCQNLKSITIQTTKLNAKNVGKNAFKTIYSKATVQVPKKQRKAYIKLLQQRGMGEKIKFI